MSARLQHMKETEERMKAMLLSSLTATLLLGLTLVIVLAFGVVLAHRQ